MERDSPTQSGKAIDNVNGPEHREHLRQALLAAADEEASAIVEQARRDITVAVHRARRDLLLIRAQLELCGVDRPSLPVTDRLELPIASLDEGVPREALVVGRTQSLRRVVHEANLELSQLSAGVVAATPRDDSVTVAIPSQPTARRVPRSRLFLTVGVLIVIVAGGTAGWVYSQRDRGAVAAQPQVAAATSTTTVPSLDNPSAVALTDNPLAARVPSARVVVQTIRPVWMRLTVDDGVDAGRMYPAGAIEALNPSRDISIRAGDAGAVLVAVDGAAPMPLGQTGQVLTRRITTGAPQASSPSAPIPGVIPAPAETSNAASIVAVPSAEELRPNSAVPIVRPSEASVTPPAANVPAAADPQHAEILDRHERWLDAQKRGDRASLQTLTAESFSLRDERPGQDSRNAGAASDWLVSDVRIDIAGVGAVLTARLRSVIAGVPNESLLSEVWVRDDQRRWALMGVRITPMTQVQQRDRTATTPAAPSR
jgi:hypothetical protein